jgi:predicted nucleic acid-binding protein
MAKLGDAFSDEQRRESVRRQLQPAAVIYIDVVFPEGRKSKYLVIAHVDHEQAPGPGVIVVDSNVIAYCWANGPLTRLAQSVRAKDADWHAPILWRSEMRNILTGYLRDRSLSGGQVARIMAAAEEALAGHEHLIPSDRIFGLARETRLSLYDCEFVALATVLSVPLVTADKAVLKAFPKQALTMEAFSMSRSARGA